MITPSIAQRYNPLLLYTALQRMWHDYENVILLKYIKKNRLQDVGKRREFEFLEQQFRIIHGRKVKEENEYQEKVKAARKERSCLPNAQAGKSCRFTRYRGG